MVICQAVKHYILLKKYLKSTQTVLRLSHKWSSNSIRSAFKDFYKEKDHVHIPSSSVIPWSDHSLEFVNAGMNQFKSVFLGRRPFPAKRIVNSQKCIRVGGKHNDLSAVGKDTYHHTFFEMLGNWSFNDYFKKEACEMSWELITKVFNIPPKHLYVTYFGGDSSLGLKADEEVKNIWLSLGVPEARILPFGVKDNFWEMGDVGPCGACTEIHYEREPSSRGHANVNRGNEDLIEIWNLVFVQFQRKINGELVPLGSRFVDTGMGLERITACLNGKSSNYDTDLFLPLFDAIQKMSGKPNYRGLFKSEDCLDTSYRIIADHSRLAAVALADGLHPNDCYNLRKAIRRSILIGWEKFGLHLTKHFFSSLLGVVTENLGETYPELITHFNRSKRLLENEEERLREIQVQISKDWIKLVSTYPSLAQLTHVSTNLIEGLNSLLPNINAWKENFPIPEAMKLIENYHLSIEVVEDVGEALRYHLNRKDLKEAISKSDNSSSLHPATSNTKRYWSSLLSHNLVTETDDSYKYDYTFNQEHKSYSYSKHQSAVVSVVSNEEISSVKAGDSGGLVLRSTNFYSTAGGQTSDRGFIRRGDNVFKVSKTVKAGNFVPHFGEVVAGEFKVGDEVILELDKGARVGASKLHTATHLLRAAVEAVAGMAYQRYSMVTDKQLTLDLFVYPLLNIQQLIQVEKIVQEWIAQNREVLRRTMPIFDLPRDENIVLVSGEKYPEDVHVISTTCTLLPELQIESPVDGVSPITTVSSSELCGGTHVFSTGHIESFSISEIKQLTDGVIRISAIHGKVASKLIFNGESTLGEFTSWDSKIISAIKNNERLRELNADFKKWKGTLKKSQLPATVFHFIEERSRYLLERMQEMMIDGSNWKQLSHEFNNYLNENPSGSIIYQMKTDYRGNTDNLEVVMNNISGRPAAFVCKGWGKVRVCIYIPQDLQTETKTLKSVLEELLCLFQEGKILESNNKEIGHFYIAGVKKNRLDSMLSQIVETCIKRFSNLKIC